MTNELESIPGYKEAVEDTMSHQPQERQDNIARSQERKQQLESKKRQSITVRNVDDEDDALMRQFFILNATIILRIWERVYLVSVYRS